MPILPQLGLVSLEPCIGRLQKKLMPSSWSLCVPPRSEGEGLEERVRLAQAEASVKVVDQSWHLVDIFPPPGVLGRNDPTLRSSSESQK